MPQLPVAPASTEVKKYYLPSTAKLPKEEQAWVMFEAGPNLVGDIESVADFSQNKAINNLQSLAARIKGWNFTDENGNPEPIDWQHVARIGADNLLYLRKLQNDAQGTPPLTGEKKSS